MCGCIGMSLHTSSQRLSFASRMPEPTIATGANDCMSCTFIQELTCNDPQALLAPTQVSQPSLDSASLESSTTLQATSRASIEPGHLQDSTVLTLSNSVGPTRTQPTQAEIVNTSSRRAIFVSTCYDHSCLAASIIPVGPSRESASPIYRSSTIIQSRSQGNSSIGRRCPNVSIIGLIVGLVWVAFLLLGAVVILWGVQRDTSVGRRRLSTLLIGVAIGLTCVALLLPGVALIPQLFGNRWRMGPSGCFYLGRKDPEAAVSPNGKPSAEDSSAANEGSSGSDGDHSCPEKAPDTDADHRSGGMCW